MRGRRPEAVDGRRKTRALFGSNPFSLMELGGVSVSMYVLVCRYQGWESGVQCRVSLAVRVSGSCGGFRRPNTTIVATVWADVEMTLSQDGGTIVGSRNLLGKMVLDNAFLGRSN